MNIVFGKYLFARVNNLAKSQIMYYFIFKFFVTFEVGKYFA